MSRFKAGQIDMLDSALRWSTPRSVPPIAGVSAAVESLVL